MYLFVNQQIMKQLLWYNVFWLTAKVKVWWKINAYKQSTYPLTQSLKYDSGFFKSIFLVTLYDQNLFRKWQGNINLQSVWLLNKFLLLLDTNYSVVTWWNSRKIQPIPGNSLDVKNQIKNFDIHCKSTNVFSTIQSKSIDTTIHIFFYPKVKYTMKCVIPGNKYSLLTLFMTRWGWRQRILCRADKESEH